MSLSGAAKHIVEETAEECMSPYGYGPQDRNTPEEVLAPIREFYGGEIGFDPCPNNWSSVSPKACAVDGLKDQWGEDSFCNPPWDEIYPWAMKGVIEHRTSGYDVLFWIPLYAETAYSRLLYSEASRVCLWRTRVNHPLHGERGNGSMWPVQLIYLGNRTDAFDHRFKEHGTIVVPVSVP